MRLLDGLAEGLLLAGVQEDVEAGVGRGERQAGELAQKAHRHPVEFLAQGQHARSVADDRQPDAGHASKRRHPLDLLFGGEPPHVADHDLTRGGEFPAQLSGICSITVSRVVGRQVDASTPALEAPQAGDTQVGHRRRGRDEGEGRVAVDAAHYAPGDGLEGGQVIAPCVARDIRLEDGDRGDPQPAARRDRLGSEQERRRDVDDVRAELLDDALHVQAGQADRKLAVRQAGDLLDVEAGVGGGSATGRHHHVSVVAAQSEVVEHLAHAVCHAIDCR